MPTGISNALLQTRHSHLPDHPEVDGPPLRILVMEDNAVIGMLLGEVLIGMGHHVCAIVATEDEGVAAAAGYKPDLMIVDAQLRDGSGVSAVATILKDGFVPHVFVSGHQLIRSGEISLSAVFLEKPYDTPHLLSAIKLALREDLGRFRGLTKGEPRLNS